MQFLDILFFTGFIMGCPIFTRLADTIGKKAILVSGLAILCTLNVLIFYIPHYSFVYVYQFILGLSTPMTTVMTYLCLTEIVPVSYRSCILTLNSGLPGLYFILVSYIFKSLRDWRVLYVLLNILNFFLFAALWFIMKDNTSSNQITNCQEEEVSQNQPEIIQSRSKNGSRPIKSGSSITTSGIIVTWYLASFLGQGMAFTSYHFKGDLFINSMMIGLADTLSSLLGGIMSSKFGTKLAVIFCSLIGVTGSIAYISLYQNSIYVPITLLAVSFGGQAADALLYSISAEQVPLHYQARFFSVAGTLSRIGMLSATIVASYIDQFMMIFLMMSLAQFLFSLLLKHSEGPKKAKFETNINN